MSERLIWIDWLKVLGMYLIVVGHMFPPGNEFVYVFSVPLFFISSGFLTKREDSLRTFGQKDYARLVEPALLWLIPIMLIYSVLDIIRTDSFLIGVFVNRWLSAIWGRANSTWRNVVCLYFIHCKICVSNFTTT